MASDEEIREATERAARVIEGEVIKPPSAPDWPGDEELPVNYRSPDDEPKPGRSIFGRRRR
jgi:hypothetical protein